MANYFFIATLVLYLMLVLLLVFLKQYRLQLLTTFSLVCWIGLIALGAFSLLVPYEQPQKLKLINYSSRRGHLYFFQTQDCQTDILYDIGVNANEESSFVVEGQKGRFGKILFLGENGQLFEFPAEEDAEGRIAVWEKELLPAHSCYRDAIEAYRRKQLYFAVATGLLISGTLLMFAGRSGYKKIKS